MRADTVGAFLKEHFGVPRLCRGLGDAKGIDLNPIDDFWTFHKNRSLGFSFRIAYIFGDFAQGKHFSSIIIRRRNADRPNE
jgi:hypothetical protein